MSVDKATWGAIKCAYCGGADTVAALSRQFGVSAHAIRYRIKRDGWQRKVPGPLRRKVGRKAAVKSKGEGRGRRADVDDGDSGTWSTADTKADVVKRLYRAILRKLAGIEKRLEQDEPLSAAESERQTRELSTMVRSFEKITGVAADIELQRKPGRKREKDRDGRASDAERMRQEIAERLERLHSQWDLGERSQDS